MENSLEIGIIITVILYSIIIIYTAFRSHCVDENDTHDEIDKL
jgi:hypothetical protein|uniref:Uncharacterized protein n=1 Tax=viral metagenome TaxID=1070528 RepID=A0A6C0LT70_9ZZZZ